MCTKIFTICLVLLITALASDAAALETGTWSEVVNGVQGRIIISEDQPGEGTGIVAVHLELRNVSNIGDPVEIYFDPTHTFRCQLFDADDRLATTAGLPSSIFQPRPFWLTLPHDSSLRFRVSVSGYGVPRNERALIPMECGDWVIKSGDKRDYELEVTFIVNPPKVDIDRHVWRGTMKLPRVKIPLKHKI